MRLYLVQINFGLGVQMAHCTPLATLLVLIIVGFVNCFATIANICGRQNIAHLFLQLFSSNITFIYMKMNLTIVTILKTFPLDMAAAGRFNDIPGQLLDTSLLGEINHFGIKIIIALGFKLAFC